MHFPTVWMSAWGANEVSFRSCPTSQPSAGSKSLSSSDPPDTSSQVRQVNIYEVGIFNTSFLSPEINFQYSALTRWAFKWIPGFQRLQRWSLFYEYELANLTKGNSIWSTKQRLTATTVRPLSQQRRGLRS